MARPQKKGLDYFPFDVDFFDDDKISAVFVEFGLKGEIAAIKLLCAIYHNGYFIEWKDSVRIKLLKVLPGVSEELLEKIVNRLVRWDFFDKKLFDSAGVLSSRGIQKRYFAVTRRNKRIASESLPHLLIELPHAVTQFPHVETQLENVDSTQKEIKGDDNNSLRSSLSLFSSSSSSTTRVCEEEDKKKPMTVGGVSVTEAFRKLSSDRDWLLSMQKRFALDSKSINGWMSSFANDCKCRGTEMHQDLSDVMRHFNDWLNIKLKPGKGGILGGNPVTTAVKDYRRVWLQAHADLCQSVSADVCAATFAQMSFESFSPAEGSGNGILTLAIPSTGLYDILERPENIRRISAVFSRYFGNNFKLQYRLYNQKEQTE